MSVCVCVCVCECVCMYIYKSVGVKENLDCTICKFYKLISRAKIVKKEKTKGARAT